MQTAVRHAGLWDTGAVLPVPDYRFHRLALHTLNTCQVIPMACRLSAGRLVCSSHLENCTGSFFSRQREEIWTSERMESGPASHQRAQEPSTAATRKMDWEETKQLCQLPEGKSEPQSTWGKHTQCPWAPAGPRLLLAPVCRPQWGEGLGQGSAAVSACTAPSSSLCPHCLPAGAQFRPFLLSIYSLLSPLL